MEYIKTLVQICDSEFPNLYYVRDAKGDRITTKLSLDLAREIATVLNEHDKLVSERDALTSALRRQANNYDYRDRAELCWCRHVDGTINPRCEGQEQCVEARAALALVREETE